MPATRRTQLLMDPDEFRQLRALARRRKTSVAELIRSAVRKAYPAASPDRRPLVEAILKLKLPRMRWKKVKKEIEAAHAGHYGIKTVVSVDPDFDQVSQVRRLAPGGV